MVWKKHHVQAALLAMRPGAGQRKIACLSGPVTRVGQGSMGRAV